MMDCYDTQVLLPYQVCTDWWDGTRSCHTQWGWFDATYCEVYGGGWEGPIYPPGGGGDPTNYPPPSCEIVGISDENPDQPILSIQANDAVVDMTLTYNGYANQTVNRTDSMALQPVNYFSLGNTNVGVQCRNAQNIYSTPIMTVTRDRNLYGDSDVVYGVWTKINTGGEPTQYTGEWHRDATLVSVDTSYSVSQVGVPNGRYNYGDLRDNLYAIGSTPRPAWDTTFVVNHFSGGQRQYWGWRCEGEYYDESICTDINDFVAPYSPSGTAIITDIDVPFQSTFGVTLFSGRELQIGPF